MNKMEVEEVKIIVGYDGSDSSKKAIEKAKELTSTCKVFEIMIAHVHEREGLEISPYYNAIDLMRLDSVKKEVFGAELKEMQEIAKEIDSGTVKTKILEGAPAKVMAEYAKEEGYDLIIVGSRGLSGIKKWIPGSVSSDIVKNCCVSVMVVK